MSQAEQDGHSEQSRFRRVAVVGGGAWGTALALTAERAGSATSLWVREAEAVEAIRATGCNPFLPEHRLPEALTVSSDLGEALTAADLVLMVVPSQFLRPLAREVEALLAPRIPVVICSKGIEAESGALMSQIVTEEMPGRPWAVLSGPSFAAEVAEGQPTAVTIAAREASMADPATMPLGLAAQVALTLGTPNFRPYLSDDPVGVEVGGAVKNVIAIACGIAAGQGLGSNPRAALITRGLAEIKRLAEALGGRRETVSGLAGMGDLTLTCSSEQSRNFSFGKALGEGRSVEEALAGKTAVVEGAENARSVTALARRLGVEMPICEAVDAILHEGRSVESAIQALLIRPLRGESRALEPHVALRHPAGGSRSGTSDSEAS
ncbi:NAD(P)H-dependent glycerol-3-phosphate dehydrogenase [Aquibaculum sediminis]|uniref:NAD(P)H-dependent glycerol-3-phosphate dehydrogenase n=1 Tax=Aquibaculum sediminis TaxID=3231907 RepID=UPI0034527890